MGPVAQHAKKGAPNRKMEAKRDARIRDYQAMIDNPMNRGKDYSGYHRPGSFKK